MTRTALKDRWKGADMADYQEGNAAHHFPPRHLCDKERELSCQSAPNKPCRRRTLLQPGWEGSAVRAQGSAAEPGVLRGNWSALSVPRGRWVEYKDAEASSGLAAAQMCWRMLGQVPEVLTVSLISSDSSVKATRDTLSQRASSHHSDEETIHNFSILSQI